MNTQQSLMTSFLKASLFTAFMIGSLIAQSYATTSLFSDTIMKMNVVFNSENEDSNVASEASMTVQNEQESSFTFGQHKLDIKSSFIAWDDDAQEHEQVLADIKVMKVNDNGEIEVIGNPSLLILRNNWAEIKVNSEEGQDGFELKMQYEDYYPAEAHNTENDETVWLNWGEKHTQPISTC